MSSTVLDGRPLWRVATGAGPQDSRCCSSPWGQSAIEKWQLRDPSTAMPGACAVMTRPDGQRSTLLFDGVTPGCRFW